MQVELKPSINKNDYESQAVQLVAAFCEHLKQEAWHG
jgi:hypothetical protein